MKYLRKYNESIDWTVDQWCKFFDLENYTINADGTVDVDGDVRLSVYMEQGVFQDLFIELTKLPIKFGTVTGCFLCEGTQITTLEGFPKIVLDDFMICGNRNLQNLIGGPIRVDGQYDCIDCNLTSLEGAPKRVEGEFWCSGNNLTDLKHSPSFVKSFDCSDMTTLTSLVGSPREVKNFFDFENTSVSNFDGAPERIGGRLSFEGCVFLKDPNGLREIDFKFLTFEVSTPIYELWHYFRSDERFIMSLDYNYVVKDGNEVKILRWKFEEALREFDLPVPQFLIGYEFV